MTITEAVKGTYATVGQENTDIQLAMVVDELANYPVAAVLAALARCRRELRKLTLADILDRLPGGHPGPEEAWALVSRCLNNEQVSIVWTDEMRAAYAIAAALAKDPMAARMAFKESYSVRVSEARARRESPAWSVSLGFDPQLRELACQEAVHKNQLSAQHVARLVSSSEPISESTLALIHQVVH